MKTNTKRTLYFLWRPFEIILFIMVIIYSLGAFVLQPLIGLNSYLCNWKHDRKLKDEIATANMLEFR